MADVGLQPALLSDDQAAALLGISVRMFHELRGQEWMPAAIQLGPRKLKWSEAELRAAIASMPRAPKTSEPLQLAKSRAAKSGRTEVRT